MEGLWNKQRAADAAAAAQRANDQPKRQGTVPGTWLTLAPTKSSNFEATEKWLSLSPSTSPLSSPVNSDKTNQVDELQLPSTFLSNEPTNGRTPSNASSSRSSSVANIKQAQISTDAPLELRRLRASDDGERLARFLAN